MFAPDRLRNRTLREFSFARAMYPATFDVPTIHLVVPGAFGLERFGAEIPLSGWTADDIANVEADLAETEALVADEIRSLRQRIREELQRRESAS